VTAVVGGRRKTMGAPSLRVRELIGAIVLALIGATRVHAQQQPVRAPDPYRDADAYEIYSLVLSHEWGWNAARLVIRETTSTDSALEGAQCIQLQDEEQNKFHPAIEDFVQVNKSVRTLLPMLNIAKPYDLVSEAELKAFTPSVLHVTEEDVWKQRHPGAEGYLELSSVGFNDNRSPALVYVSHCCGTLCAGGSFYLLEKKDGKWQAAKGTTGMICGWIS